MTPYEQKTHALMILRARYVEQRDRVASIDERLREYFDSLCIVGEVETDADPDDPQPLHSVYEILGAIKFLRLLRTYPFSTKKVQAVIKLREGEWKHDGKHWRHVSGGIRCPGTGGAQVYRWQPFQVFVLASVFGFHTWIDTHMTESEKADLLTTERVNPKTKHIEDRRRLCTDFTFYAPRKTDKTGLSAFIQVVFFLLEDNNAECYCCANSASQSSLLYRRTRQMLSQLDDGQRFRMTETVCDWRQSYKGIRDSSIRPLSAGGKTKDGMFAALCCADEYGSASYTNGKSDMKMLVDVIESSMGPRREPLTFTTTTAGRVSAGPFIEKLGSLHRLLLRELDIEAGTESPTLAYDRTLCICFEPDDWERDEEYLLSSRTVRRKVNPMLGLIVQHQFYDDGAAKARMDGDAGEYIAKYMNVYASDTVCEWLTAEDIRRLQVPMRIDDCKMDEGWVVFAGLDFSKGDDLNGVSYLAYNVNTGEFFADMDSYLSEDAANQSPIRELLYKWNGDGWLHICPGKTFDPSWPVNRIIELSNAGINFILFLYDPYNAKIVMNALGQWVFDMGVNPADVIVPARQNFATYNPVVNEFDYMVKRSVMNPDTGKNEPSPMIHLSENPMWPWQFGNCVLAESSDGMENRKPVKRQTDGSCKVDNVQMLLSALMGYDMAEGKVVNPQR